MDVEKIKQRYEMLDTRELMRMEIHEKDPFLNKLIEDELTSRGVSIEDRSPVLAEESKKYSWRKALLILFFVWLVSKLVLNFFR